MSDENQKAKENAATACTTDVQGQQITGTVWAFLGYLTKPFLNLTSKLQFAYYREETTMPKSGNRVGGLNLGSSLTRAQPWKTQYSSVVQVVLEHAGGKW